MDLVGDLRNYRDTTFASCLFPNMLQFVGIKCFGKYIYFQCCCMTCLHLDNRNNLIFVDNGW